MEKIIVGFENYNSMHNGESNRLSKQNKMADLKRRMRKIDNKENKYWQ